MAIDLTKERERLLKAKIEEDKNIGERMRRKRKAKGLKACYVALRMGYVRAYISDLEAGKRHWRPDLIEAYNKAINL